MANDPINGKDIRLDLDISLTATPDWAVVGCLTETDIDTTRETIDANSKCGDATLAGTASHTTNFAGVATKTLDVGQVSINELAEINYNGDGESRHWRILDNTTDGDIIYREFRGPLLNFNESFNNNETVNFTGAISIVGGVLLAPAT